MDAEPLTVLFNETAASPPTLPLTVGDAPQAPMASPMGAVRPEPPKEPLADLFRKPEPLMELFGTQPEPSTTPEPPTPTTPVSETPGFWPVISQSVMRGAAENVRASTMGLQAAIGTPLPAIPPVTPPPDVNDEIGKLLAKPDGWDDPKWYAAQIFHGVGGSVTPIAGAIAGGVAGSAVAPGIGTLLGAAGGTALGVALPTFVPEYQKAISEGLTHDDAIQRAVISTGIAAAFGGVMGLAPAMPLFGQTVMGALRRPLTELLTQIGVIQPAIGLAQQVATAASQNKDLSGSEAALGYITNVGGGAVFTAAHRASAGVVNVVRQTPAGPETVSQVLRDVTLDPPSAFTPVVERRMAASEMGLGVERMDDSVFYSRVRQVVIEKGPEKATSVQWLSTIRNAPGVRAEEVEALNLPRYLADREGRVSKSDLIAHIEENQIRLEEKIVEERPDQIVEGYDPRTGTVTMPNTRFHSYRVPGPFVKYGEIRLILPDMESRKDLPRFGDMHWPEKNVLGFVQYTERVDRDGKKVLFIDTAQSDWHQRGRDEGYKTKESAEREVKTSQLRRAIGDADEALYNGLDENTSRIMTRLSDRVYDAIRVAQSPEEVYRVTSSARMRFGEEIGGRLEEFARRVEEWHVDVEDRRNAPSHVPDAPFKTSWAELLFKRMLRYAADNGYERISWANPEQVIAMFPGLNDKQKAGMHEFYGKNFPSMAKAWGRRLGTESGKVYSDPERFGLTPLGEPNVLQRELHSNQYLDITPAAATKVRLGLPLFSEPPITKVRFAEEVPSTVYKMMGHAKIESQFQDSQKIAKVIHQISQKVGIRVPLEIVIHPGFLPKEVRALTDFGAGMIGEQGRGFVYATTKGYVMHIASGAHPKSTEIYATMAHELGHVVMWEKLDKLPPMMKQLFVAAHGMERNRTMQENPTYREYLARRDNAVSNFYVLHELSERPMLSLTPERIRYWTGFEEYFAEQVAKWATTNERPLSILDAEFKALGASVRSAVMLFQYRMGGVEKYSGKPTKMISDWLESFHEGSGPFAADIMAAGQLEGQRRAQLSLDRDGTPEVFAEPPSGVTNGIQMMVRAAMRDEVPERMAVDVAHVDRMSKKYEWMLSLPQIAERNPHVRPLQYYTEGIGLFNAKVREEAEKAVPTLKAWKKLGRAQGDSVAHLIDDWANMRYRTEEEITNKTRRMPTEGEFLKLVKDNGVSEQGLQVFKRSVLDMNGKLEELARVLQSRAARIPDEITRFQALASVEANVARLRGAPYFPFLRSGEFTVTTYGPKGEIRYFSRHMTEREQKAEFLRITNEVREGDTPKMGFLGKDVEPLSGLAPAMFDSMGETLKLSESQRIAMEQLKFEHSPEQSYLHRMQRKSFTPGYSQDFMRSYANYMFHSARYFTRVEHSERLQGYIRQIREERNSREDATQTDWIANFAQKHFDYVMDPKPDFAELRSAIFVWRLGLSPASALTNLTQTVNSTWPWLAHNFGDIKGGAALIRASTRLSNYYKTSTLKDITDADLRGVSEAVKQGVLQPTATPELAGLSEGRNILAYGKTAATQAWMKFSELSGTMFQAAETWNRRVAFDATWRLALDNPDVPYIQRSREANPAEYRRLVSEGWSPIEASAYVAAKRATESTQFVYDRSHRPQFMQGKKSALLMFKFWQQQMLFNMWNYPAMGARSALTMVAMGGLMGFPFAEDIKGLVKAVGWQLFGKDWDVESDIRKLITDHYDQKAGPELADSILHGAARNGLGLPQLFEMLGMNTAASVAGRTDRSASVGLGDVIPLDVGNAFGPNRGTELPIARETQNVLGAAFGFPFDVYKAAMSSQLNWNDTKRWERVYPQWLSNISKSYRYFSEGKERDAKGNTVLRFDVSDTAQMSEVLWRAAGYNPSRLAKEYDRISATKEAETYWDLRRDILLRQAWDRRRNNDTEGYDRILSSIRNFNKEVQGTPARMKVITADSLADSFRKSAEASAKRDAGIAPKRSDIPIEQEMRRIFPNTKIEKTGTERVK